MAKTIDGGTVHLTGNKRALAKVEELYFPAPPPVGGVPDGTKGTLFLDSVPSVVGSYKRGEHLAFESEKPVNNCVLLVDRAFGPAKYNIRKFSEE